MVRLVGLPLVSKSREGQLGHSAEIIASAPLRVLRSLEEHATDLLVVDSIHK